MRRAVLLMVFTMASMAALVASQDPPAQQPQPPLFRSGASMVAVSVTVLDGSKPVSGLTQGDFEVFEDGVQQQVQFFESRSVPLDVILLLDTSSSMGDKIEVVHEAARGFMKGLRPGDRGAVVTFADSVNVMQELTSDTGSDRHRDQPDAGEGSDRAAHGHLRRVEAVWPQRKWFAEVRRQAIAVLSDGEDTKSLVSFDDVMAMARKTGVNIYTIALRTPSPAERHHRWTKTVLERRLRDEGAGKRNRRAGLLPGDSPPVEGRVSVNRRRALGPVLDRLLAVESAK